LLGTAVNWAEISEDNPVDENGDALFTTDIDSTPDNII